MGVLFGTDGIRGIANESLTGELAYVGRATATTETKGKIYFNRKDTESPAMMLEAALCRHQQCGRDVYHLGLFPLPVLRI